MAAGLTEVFGNLASTTLNNSGTLTSGATSCTVTSGAAPFPQTGNFRILIDSEIILVTAVSTNTFTLVRGQEGTAAAAHNDGSTVTHVLTKGALQAIQQARPVFTNTASGTYTMDSTGNPFDVLILHNKSGAVTYVMPAPTAGRHIEVYDVTGAINTLANNVFFVPNASEKFNASAGYALTGTAYHFTNGSGTVTATSSQFKEELAVGMSIQSSNQSGVNYIITAIASDTSMTVTPTFGGLTTTTATATRTSLTFAANAGKLFFDSDGTDWYATGDGTPTILKYTASSGAGTGIAPFIPPQGVTTAQFRGCGGGGGGGSPATATSSPGAGGGGGALQSYEEVACTPMIAYAVTCGGGGAGATAGAGGGAAGSDTTVGSLVTFGGASGGQGNAATTLNNAGGLCVKDATSDSLYGVVFTTGGFHTATASNFMSIAAGGPGVVALSGLGGALNPVGGFAAGTGGSAASSRGGGGGGGAGPRGAGGNGGAGSATGGGSGSNAGANTGAGGGGAGCGGTSVQAGGNGGSGYVDIIYVL